MIRKRDELSLYDENVQTAEVVAIDLEEISMVLECEDRRREMLNLRHLADRHIRLGADDPFRAGGYVRSGLGPP